MNAISKAHMSVFLQQTTIYLKEMFDLDCSFGADVDTVESLTDYSDFAVSIPFTGTVNGEYLLCCSVETGQKIVGSTGLPQDPEDFSEGLAELLNTIAGASIAHLLEDFPTLTITAPKLSFGKVIYPRVPIICSTLSTIHGEIKCLFFLDMMRLEITSELERQVEHRLQAEEQIRYQLKLEEALSSATKLFTNVDGPNFETFLAMLGEPLGADWGMLLLLNRDSLMSRIISWPHLRDDCDVVAHWVCSEALASTDKFCFLIPEDMRHLGCLFVVPIKDQSTGSCSAILCFSKDSKLCFSVEEQRLLTVAAELLSHDRARRLAEEQLLHDALYDSLTNLPNRTLFLDRLKHALERTHRDHSKKFALMFLDLDRFKIINDSLGHLLGDHLLIELGHRLKSCIRPEDTLARLGGDEFTLLIENIVDINEVKNIVSRIKGMLTKPFRLQDHEIFITVSIGIAMSSHEYKDSKDFLRDADTAMYRAKHLGRDRYVIFDQDMHDSVVKILELEHDMHRAIDDREFYLNYQPILSLETGKVIGAEALIRWAHPTRKWVSPEDFIPIAEETGLILPIGVWVLETAAAQVREWIEKGLEQFSVAVNCSAHQFHHQNLPLLIKDILKKYQIPASALKIELTESAFMHDIEQTIETLGELRALGIRISIDDFGTGYSSLAYLKSLPIDVLKIDKSFVDGILDDEGDEAIIATVIALAHNLNMTVIAEGVETEEQLLKLKEMHCDQIQGYLISRPLPALEVIDAVNSIPY